jgi:hypothetical protein
MGQDPPRLGERIRWNDSPTTGQPRYRDGVVIYNGPAFHDVPNYDEKCWVSKEEYDFFCGLHGRRRFYEVVHGYIIRKDRFDNKGKPLVPWYYAPTLRSWARIG